MRLHQFNYCCSHVAHQSRAETDLGIHVPSEPPSGRSLYFKGLISAAGEYHTLEKVAGLATLGVAATPDSPAGEFVVSRSRRLSAASLGENERNRH